MAETEESQIAMLNQEIKKKQDEINKIEVEIKNNIEERDQLNVKVKNAWQEINEIKKQRDDLNAQVRALKEQREGMRTKSAEVIDRIKETRARVDELKTKTPRVSQRELQEELNAIEWKISTTSLDLQEEKHLIERVKQLEILLRGYKKIDKQYQKISELQNERKPFKDGADSLHSELTDLAKRSQDLHLELMSKIEQAKKDKIEADLHHEVYIQGKEQTKQLLVEIAVLTGQIKRLRNTLYEKNKAIRAKNQVDRQAARTRINEEKVNRKIVNESLREKLGSQARDKLQRGERLNWNEFQLLDDQEEDDENLETQS